MNCTTTSKLSIRMMDDDVLLPDGGEAVAAEVADALGKARVVGLEHQIGPLRDNESRGAGEAEQPFAQEDVLRRRASFVAHEPPAVRST